LLIYLNLSQGAGYLKRADSEKLHDIFLKYATIDRNGEKYITSEDFVRKFLGFFEEGEYFQPFFLSLGFTICVIITNVDVIDKYLRYL
jgi:hypothetical protein